MPASSWGEFVSILGIWEGPVKTHLWITLFPICYCKFWGHSTPPPKKDLTCFSCSPRITETIRSAAGKESSDFCASYCVLFSRMWLKPHLLGPKILNRGRWGRGPVSGKRRQKNKKAPKSETFRDQSERRSKMSKQWNLPTKVRTCSWLKKPSWDVQIW